MFHYLIKINNKYNKQLKILDFYILQLVDYFKIPNIVELVRRGKRIRSRISFDIYYQNNLNNNNTDINIEMYKTLALLELTHLSSLLHDDVIDNNKTRRNTSSLFSIYGAKKSILTGDYLLINIFNEALKLPEKLFKNFIKYSKSTAYGAILEQQLTINSTINDYFKVVWLKTSSFFIFATLCGLFFANAPLETLKCNLRKSICFGIIFQIQNDLDEYKKYNFIENEDYINSNITFPIIILRLINLKYEKFFLEKSQNNYIKIQSIINSLNFCNLANTICAKYINIIHKQ